MENDLDLDLDLDLNKGTYTNQPFEQFNFGYSAKNIPICSEKQYIKAPINKTEQFVKNLHWRTFFFLKLRKLFLPDLETQMRGEHEQQPQIAWETVVNDVKKLVIWLDLGLLYSCPFSHPLIFQRLSPFISSHRYVEVSRYQTVNIK